MDHGPVARSTIARLAGLSPAAVSRLCTELAGPGLLREVPEAVTAKGVGRPHVPVQVDTGRRVACGLHIAFRYATLALVDLRGRVIARGQIEHPAADPVVVLSRVARRLPEFVGEQAGGRTPLGLGVAGPAGRPVRPGPGGGTGQRVTGLATPEVEWPSRPGPDVAPRSARPLVLLV